MLGIVAKKNSEKNHRKMWSNVSQSRDSS